MGRQAWEAAADVSDRAALLRMADEAEAAAGPIDILVNNAGTIRRRAAVEHSFDDWTVVLRTNLDSAFVLAQRFGRGMVERGEGKIKPHKLAVSYTPYT